MESLLTQVAPVVELLGQSPNGGIMLPNGTQVPAPSSQLPTPPNGSVPLPIDAGSSNMPLASGSRRGTEDETNPCGIRNAVPRETAENDDVTDRFGQLTLDENGHMRWIGGSSTMALMQSFRDVLDNRPQRPYDGSPYSDGSDHESTRPNINMLYFPVGLGFGHVHALPGVHEAQWPAWDLADKLVRGTSRFLIRRRNADPERWRLD